jgi:WD40 repeat protein
LFQDALVKLWERRAINQQSNQEQNKTVRSWFGNMTSARSQPDRAYSWFCRATFEPKSEAVRDMQWSKFQDDGERTHSGHYASTLSGCSNPIMLLFSSVFALVTVSGSLIVYSMHVASRALVKIAAHTGDATSLDWHPTKPYVIATGGAGDRCVKGKSSLQGNRYSRRSSTVYIVI